MRAEVLLLAGAALLGACEAETGGADTAVTATSGTEAMPQPPSDEGTPEVNANEPDASECGADKLARWLNALPTETVREEIRETVGHNRIRYIAPGDMVTMDFRPDRLNVETGEDGRIKLFRCG